MANNVRGIFLGHAGFYFAFKSVKLLIDPWFSAEGAFYNSWHQWPDNSFIPEKFPEIYSANLLWISHEHADHFDEKFLSLLDKNLLVVVPCFISKNLLNRIKNLGFTNIRELKHLETLEIENKSFLTLVIENPPYTEHSSMYFKFDDIGIFHNSDSSFSALDLEEFSKKRDTQLYIGQYSVTSPFPNVMNWPESEKKLHRDNHLSWSIDRFVHGAKYLHANYAIPCAGPSLVLCDETFDITRSEILNDDSGYADEIIFHRIHKLAPELELCPMRPGQNFLISSSGLLYEKFPPLSKDERLDQFRLICKNRFHAANKHFESSDINKLFWMHLKILENAKNICKDIFNNLKFIFSVYFIDLDKRFETDFSEEALRCEIQDGKINKSLLLNSIYQIEIHSKLWADFIDQNSYITFDDINYSQRFKITQSKDGFSGDFIKIMRALHDNNLLREVNKRHLCDSNETIDILYSGETYKIKRYCPHLGVDLMGHIPTHDGLIICKGHGWRFDVVTGTCIFGDQSKSIKG